MELAGRAIQARCLAIARVVMLAIVFALAVGCPSAAYAVETPVVSSPEANSTLACFAGSDSVQLEVVASVNDGGALSYQWQTSTSVEKSGKNKGNLKNPVDIDGAVAPLLELAAVLENGGKYYQCVVTNTLDGSSAVARSKWFFVKVVETEGAWDGEGGSGSWSFSQAANELAISGSGAMPDYANPGSVPWSGVFSLMAPNGTVSVSEGIVNLGSYALGSLAVEGVRVNLPNSLSSIHKNAFYNVSGIESLHIPESVTEIQSEAFYSAKGLKEIAIPASVREIGDSAFSGCTNLAAVSFEDGDEVLSIGKTAFAGAPLSDVTIPDRCASIGDNAFFENAGTNSLKIASVPAGCAFTPAGTLDSAQMGFLDSFPSACAVTRRCSVTFADDEGSTLNIADASYVCQGPDAVAAGSAVFEGDLPTKASDGDYTYKFAGWVTRDAEGNEAPVELDADGNIVATGDMTVYASFTATPLADQEISGLPESLSLVEGDAAVALGASAKGALSYESSDEAVATVDADGNVTAVGAGSATITVNAAATDECKAASAQVPVTVTAKAVVDAKAGLQKAIEEAKALDTSKLTADQKAALEDAIKAAEQALASGEPTAEALNAALTAMSAAAKTATEQIEAAGKASAAPAGSKAKAANPMTVKAKTIKAKAKKKTVVKKAKAFAVKNAKGKVTFEKLSGSKKAAVSAAGKVTVKKGLKKDKTYKVKVKVTAAGDASYEAASKTVTLKVKVK